MPQGRFTKTVEFISHIRLVKRPQDTWRETGQTSCLSHSKWSSQIFFLLLLVGGLRLLIMNYCQSQGFRKDFWTLFFFQYECDSQVWQPNLYCRIYTHPSSTSLALSLFVRCIMQYATCQGLHLGLALFLRAEFLPWITSATNAIDFMRAFYWYVTCQGFDLGLGYSISPPYQLELEVCVNSSWRNLSIDMQHAGV